MQQWSWHSQPSPCWGSPGGAQHPPSLRADVLASQKSAAGLLQLELSHPPAGGALTARWRLHLCSLGARCLPCALKLLLASVWLEGVTSRAWQLHHASCPGLSRRKEELCGVGWRGDRGDTGSWDSARAARCSAGTEQQVWERTGMLERSRGAARSQGSLGRAGICAGGWGRCREGDWVWAMSSSGVCPQCAPTNSDALPVVTPSTHGCPRLGGHVGSNSGLQRAGTPLGIPSVQAGLLEEGAPCPTAPGWVNEHRGVTDLGGRTGGTPAVLASSGASTGRGPLKT